MDSLKILVSSYKPNSAPTNRLLSFLRGFSELGVNAEVVFVYPSEASDRLDCIGLPNISVSYMWDKYRCRNKLYKYLRSFADVKRWVNYLHAGDTIFLLGSSEYLPIIVKRRDLRIYQERTEHPAVNPLIPNCLQKKYLAACKKLSGMFVISTALKRVYEQMGVDNVHVVNMTVDANRFKGMKKSIDVEPYIAYCGTASNNKDGVDDLIKAFSIVVKTHPDLKLKIMGKAPSRDDESGNLKLVEDLGIKDKVVFTGIIPATEMPQMLKNATIVALARPDSLQAQCGFPTKLGEYLLSENPVVVTKVGDIPLFLSDNETALLSRERNPEEFASKMVWVIDHPQEAETIGRKGAEVALREFNYLTESKKIIDTITRDKQ